jgi:hypothetical protein
MAAQHKAIKKLQKENMRKEETMEASFERGRKLQEHIVLLRKTLEELKRSHTVVDDCWYSCPMGIDENGDHESCNKEEIEKGICLCGADEANAKIEAALAATQPIQP